MGGLEEIAIGTSEPHKRGDSAHGKRTPKTKKGKSNARFVVVMIVTSFVLSILFSSISSAALKDTSVLVSLLVLAVFVVIGVIFDIIGVATTSADVKTFHSMAARKVRGAKDGIWLIRNAERVSSFCNDVVGDICGIISGATGAIIAAELVATGLNAMITPLLVTGTVAACTIGGKAIGKSIAVSQSDRVVFFAGKTVYLSKKIFGRGD